MQGAVQLARELVESRPDPAHEFGHERGAGRRLPSREEHLETVEIQFEPIDEIAISLEHLEHGVESQLPHRLVRVIEQVAVSRLPGQR